MYHDIIEGGAPPVESSLITEQGCTVSRTDDKERNTNRRHEARSASVRLSESQR
jgi:hypothetical protein